MKTLREHIESLSPAAVKNSPTALAFAIGAAISVEVPAGSPVAIRSAAAIYIKTAERFAETFTDLHKINTDKLPNVWTSNAAGKAEQKLVALGKQIQNTAEAFYITGNALDSWGAAPAQFHTEEQKAFALLSHAASVLTPGSLDDSRATEALIYSAHGCSMRLAIVDIMAEMSTEISEVITAAAAQKPEQITLLSSYAIGADIARFEAMSPANQTAFEKLVEAARSPQESLYLWKALAAGNSLSTIEQFDKAIHPCGNNPQWLAEHLEPDLTGAMSGSTSRLPKWFLQANGNPFLATYDGGTNASLDSEGWDIYDQGGYGDCVAASTVVARASVDPVYMLGLTTGFEPTGAKEPWNEGSFVAFGDLPGAFNARLQAAYASEYQMGQKAEHDPPNPFTGIGTKGENALSNQLLSQATGTSYKYESFGGAGARQAALSRIEAGVSSGRPVLLDVNTPKQAASKKPDAEGHQVVVLGYDRDNNKMEIYNPWGFTEWVDTSKFVDGQLPIASMDSSNEPEKLSAAYGADVPEAG